MLGGASFYEIAVIAAVSLVALRPDELKRAIQTLNLLKKRIRHLAHDTVDLNEKPYRQYRCAEDMLKDVDKSDIQLGMYDRNKKGPTDSGESH